MSQTAIEVLHRDADFLVVYKPTGLPTTSPDGRGCLVEQVRPFDPRAMQLHPTSRLDAEVTGVVTFARTPRGVAHSLAMRREGRYDRLYLALAAVAPTPESGEWTGSIGVDPRDKRRRVVTTAHDAQQAETRYSVAARAPHAVLLALHPHTGRTHQLRVHSSHAGAPFLGDIHYGGPRRLTLPDGRVLTFTRVMLHCTRVSFPLPSGKPGIFVADPPDDLRSAWLALGGDPEALSLDAIEAYAAPKA